MQLEAESSGSLLQENVHLIVAPLLRASLTADNEKALQSNTPTGHDGKIKDALRPTPYARRIHNLIIYPVNDYAASLLHPDRTASSPNGQKEQDRLGMQHGLQD